MYLLDQLLLKHRVEPSRFSEPAILPVSYLYAHDRNAFKIINELDLLGVGLEAYSKLKLGRKVLFFLDHYSPAPTPETAALHAQQRAVAKALGAPIFDEGSGVGHQLALETSVRPNDIAVGVDSHTCTVGAVGALGLRMPPVSVAAAMVSGTVEFFRPKIIRIQLLNSLERPSTGKDVALFLAGLGPRRFADALLEVGGPGLNSLELPDRITLANLSTDLHARSVLFEVDNLIVDSHNISDEHMTECSLDEYTDRVVVDLAQIPPFVARPGSIHNVVPLSELRTRARVDVVAVGSCTNGQFEDFVAFCNALGNDKIAPHVRVIVTPTSGTVLKRLSSSGLLSKLIELGATINPPGCGPCMGLHQGILSDGEICVATGSRNTAGRMGSNKAEIYLVSPRTAGLAAIAGYIGH